MPTLNANGAELHYQQTGGDGSAVVFAHGLLWDGRLFDAQVAALRERYRCITFDFRGHGRSQVTRGGYDADTLAADTAAVIEATGAAPCHLVGLSMGAFVCMRVAFRRPELVRSLVLLGPSADAEPRRSALRYNALAMFARVFGIRPVARAAMKILYGPAFLNDPARAAVREEMRRRLIANSRAGAYRATRAVTSRRPCYAEIAAIRCPTLCLVGEADDVMPHRCARRIAEQIPGARIVVIPRSGHISVVEEPQAVNAALAEFLGLADLLASMRHIMSGHEGGGESADFSVS